jgi:hypothetical protein
MYVLELIYQKSDILFLLIKKVHLYMKFFSKKNKASQEASDDKIQDKKIIDVEAHEVKSNIIIDDSLNFKEDEITFQNKNTNSNPIGKIDVIQIEASKANISEDSEHLIEKKDKKSKKNKKEAKVKQLKEKSEFEEKVDKIIDSVAQLFAPFKDLMLKIIPSSKGIIKLLDLFAIMIAKLTKFIILRFPLFVRFLKSKFFRIILIFIIFMFVFGAVFSKIINSNYYVNNLENAIYESTGYKAKINGLIKVSFVPSFSISLSNVSFYVDENINTNSSQFKITQFDANNLKIKFNFFPLFIGNFSIKNIDIIGATLDLQTSDTSSLKDTDYRDIILGVERSIKSNVSVEKINEIEKKQQSALLIKPAGNLNSNVSQDALALLDNLDSLIQGVMPQEESPVATPKKEEALPKSEAIEEETIDNQAEEVLKPEQEEQVDKQSEESSAPLISQKRDSDSLNYSFLSSFLSNAVTNIKFSFNDVDTFVLRRGKINIINKQGQKLLIIDNISSTVSSSFMGNVKSEGIFRFADNNINYLASIDYQKEQMKFNVEFAFASNSADVLKLSGFKNINTGDISADISVKNQGILIFINKFLVEINPKKSKKSSFEAKLLLNSNVFKIYDINMVLNEDIYNGSFTWDFAGSANNVFIDLRAKLNDLSKISNGIDENLSKSISQGSYFLSAVEEIINWKNAKMNLFKTNNFIVNFKVENTKVNDIIIDNLSIGFLVTNFNKLYVYDFSVKTKEYNAKLTGRLDLDSKSAIIALDANGKISATGQTLGFKPKAIEFLQNIGKEKDSYSLSTKLRLENNKMLFSDFSGVLGDMKLNDTYIIFTQRVGDSDIVVSTKIDELNLTDISNIYNKQITNLTYEKVEDVNIFGLPENFKVKMDIEIKKSTLRGIPFKNVNLDLSLFKTGFSVNKFSALGERGGSLTASISADSVVLPVIAGHINLENLVLRFEDSKDIFFKNTNLVGNVVLNGKIRFNGDSYNNPFTSINGDVTFIKQERISVNRFANIDGLFLTLTDKNTSGKDTIFVNDIYGRANIKDSVIELYPISILYINKNKEYRGVSQAMIDLRDGSIKAEGAGDMSSDTSNKVKFDLQGSFLNPKANVSFFKGARSSSGVKPKEKDISLVNSKTHSKINNLNNTKNKNNFNNTYNSNISNKSYDKLKDSLYDDMIDENTKGKSNIFPEGQNRAPSSGAVTKNQDNTKYYSNSK